MILAFPLKAAGKMVGLPDEKTAKRILDKIAHELCKELAISRRRLPTRIGSRKRKRGGPHNPSALKSSGRVAEIYGVISKRASA
jgi:hypothetical protein